MNWKNWKTSIAGLLAGIGGMAQAGVIPHFGHVGSVSVDQALGAIGVMLLGWMAKDKNVTGGEVQQ